MMSSAPHRGPLASALGVGLPSNTALNPRSIPVSSKVNMNQPWSAVVTGQHKNIASTTSSYFQNRSVFSGSISSALSLGTLRTSKAATGLPKLSALKDAPKPLDNALGNSKNVSNKFNPLGLSVSPADPARSEGKLLSKGQHASLIQKQTSSMAEVSNSFPPLERIENIFDVGTGKKTCDVQQPDSNEMSKVKTVSLGVNKLLSGEPWVTEGLTKAKSTDHDRRTREVYKSAFQVSTESTENRSEKVLTSSGQEVFHLNEKPLLSETLSHPDTSNAHPSQQKNTGHKGVERSQVNEKNMVAIQKNDLGNGNTIKASSPIFEKGHVKLLKHSLNTFEEYSGTVRAESSQAQEENESVTKPTIIDKGNYNFLQNTGSLQNLRPAKSRVPPRNEAGAKRAAGSRYTTVRNNEDIIIISSSAKADSQKKKSSYSHQELTDVMKEETERTLDEQTNKTTNNVANASGESFVMMRKSTKLLSPPAHSSTYKAKNRDSLYKRGCKGSKYQPNKTGAMLYGKQCGNDFKASKSYQSSKPRFIGAKTSREMSHNQYIQDSSPQENLERKTFKPYCTAGQDSRSEKQETMSGPEICANTKQFKRITRVPNHDHTPAGTLDFESQTVSSKKRLQYPATPRSHLSESQFGKTENAKFVLKVIEQSPLENFESNLEKATMSVPSNGGNTEAVYSEKHGENSAHIKPTSKPVSIGHFQRNTFADPLSQEMPKCPQKCDSSLSETAKESQSRPDEHETREMAEQGYHTVAAGSYVESCRRIASGNSQIKIPANLVHNLRIGTTKKQGEVVNSSVGMTGVSLRVNSGNVNKESLKNGPLLHPTGDEKIVPSEIYESPESPNPFKRDFQYCVNGTANLSHVTIPMLPSSYGSSVVLIEPPSNSKCNEPQATRPIQGIYALSDSAGGAAGNVGSRGNLMMMVPLDNVPEYRAPISLQVPSKELAQDHIIYSNAIPGCSSSSRSGAYERGSLGQIYPKPPNLPQIAGYYKGYAVYQGIPFDSGFAKNGVEQPTHVFRPVHCHVPEATETQNFDGFASSSSSERKVILQNVAQENLEQEYVMPETNGLRTVAGPWEVFNATTRTVPREMMQDATQGTSFSQQSNPSSYQIGTDSIQLSSRNKQDCISPDTVTDSYVSVKTSTPCEGELASVSQKQSVGGSLSRSGAIRTRSAAGKMVKPLDNNALNERSSKPNHLRAPLQDGEQHSGSIKETNIPSYDDNNIRFVFINKRKPSTHPLESSGEAHGPFVKLREVSPCKMSSQAKESVQSDRNTQFPLLEVRSDKSDCKLRLEDRDRINENSRYKTEQKKTVVDSQQGQIVGNVVSRNGNMLCRHFLKQRCTYKPCNFSHDPDEPFRERVEELEPSWKRRENSVRTRLVPEAASKDCGETKRVVPTSHVDKREIRHANEEGCQELRSRNPEFHSPDRKATSRSPDSNIISRRVANATRRARKWPEKVENYFAQRCPPSRSTTKGRDLVKTGGSFEKRGNDSAKVGKRNADVEEKKAPSQNENPDMEKRVIIVESCNVAERKRNKQGNPSDSKSKKMGRRETILENGSLALYRKEPREETSKAFIPNRASNKTWECARKTKFVAKCSEKAASTQEREKNQEKNMENSKARVFDNALRTSDNALFGSQKGAKKIWQRKVTQATPTELEGVGETKAKDSDLRSPAAVAKTPQVACMESRDKPENDQTTTRVSRKLNRQGMASTKNLSSKSRAWNMKKKFNTSYSSQDKIVQARCFRTILAKTLETKEPGISTKSDKPVTSVDEKRAIICFRGNVHIASKASHKGPVQGNTSNKASVFEVEPKDPQLHPLQGSLATGESLGSIERRQYAAARRKRSNIRGKLRHRNRSDVTGTSVVAETGEIPVEPDKAEVTPKTKPIIIDGTYARKVNKGSRWIRSNSFKKKESAV